MQSRSTFEREGSPSEINSTSGPKPELAVVIPVYNEAANLKGLLEDWEPIFRNLGTSYQLVFVNDGSTDGSADVLLQIQKYNHSLIVVNQPNAGHGAAILRGYRMALEAAAWVFQIDGDHQLDPGAFAELWTNREQYDLLLAERREKNATLPRRLLSILTATLVRFLYGGSMRDVNAPYRLMRANLLREALILIPDDSLAPNVLLTCWFIRKKARIFTGVTDQRRGGVLRKSRMSRHIFRIAVRSVFQLISFRRRQ